MSKVLRQEQCPQCAEQGLDTSGDNLTVYENGAYCFACGYSSGTKMFPGYQSGQLTDLPTRGLTKETMGRYAVKTTKYTGHFTPKDYVYEEEVVIFNLFKEGKLVAQKLRLLKDKSICVQRGLAKDTDMFGLQAFTPSERIPLVICEAEIDAMTVNQVSNIPAIAVGGAQHAYKKISQALDKIQGYKHIILCFDEDEAGRAAVDKCLGLFKPGTVRVAHLPLKDANEMLQAGREDELKKCIWNAEIVKPATIVTVNDLRQKVLQKPEVGLSWHYQSMTEVTYGLRPGEIYVVAAAEGVGKTEFVKEMIFHLIDQQTKIGVFSFEQSPESTVQRLIGSKVNKRLHLPGGEWWDEEIINKEMDKMSQYLYLYDNRGALNLGSVLTYIRYLVNYFGVKFIVLDNLTALCSETIIDGRSVGDAQYIGHVMLNLHSLVKELRISICVVSHLNDDKLNKQVYLSTSPKNKDHYISLTADDMNDLINKPGMTWESGRMPTLGNIYGSGTVKKLADYVIVLARNRVSKDPDEHSKTIVKFLKCRLDSKYEGHSFNLFYNYHTGRLEEQPMEKVFDLTKTIGKASINKQS